MASAIVTYILDAALDEAKSTVLNEIKLMLGFPEQLGDMKGHVKHIKAVLDDADKQKTGSDMHSRSVLNWLKDVEEAAFEAEIVLDELLYESLSRRLSENNEDAAPQVCECSSFRFILKYAIRNAYLNVTLGRTVRRINATFKELNSQITTLSLVSGEHHATDHVAANRETDSLVYKPLVAGRDEEESRIVDMLLSGSSIDNPPYPVLVLPIVGMGGLGKTTLAKLVYDNQQIKDRFPKRSWTCVSSKDDDTDILKGILECLKGGVGISGREAIVQEIRKELGGERFLFVFDDVWDDVWWEKFFESLVGLNGAIDSCCVLTKRSKNGNFSYFFKPFVLETLSDDSCWSIVSSRATNGKVEREACLNAYKEQLLKKCQGLPLAAKVIGSLLGRSKETEDWTSIMENEVMKDVHGSVDKEINPILRLSYDYLPNRCLKSCFVYCSVYPKDAEMDGDELIELWMAQGYLEDGAKRGETMEKIGANYLAILLESSLLEKCWSRERWRYQMHDLVHDLAESISKDRYSAFRHVALGVEKLKDRWNEESTLAQIEEARIEEADISDARLSERLSERIDASLSECIHARVMHLYLGNVIKIFPKDVGKLIHLRSLTISGECIETLPESLCRLYNLQTLNLSGCRILKCLPQGLINLISLRHIHFHWAVLWREDFQLPPNMGRLTCLQTLEFFNVWEGNGHGIKELGFMENLMGSLSIRNLEVVESKVEAASAKLVAKKNMIELEFKWGSTTGLNNGEDVLQGLEPCSALQRLTITNFMGVQLPGWLGKLSVLVRLELNNCHNITQLGCSGDDGFPNLKSLELEDCENITQLGCSGDGGFPKIETLFISGSSQLSSAPTSFPVLEDLNVMDIQVSAVRDIISTTTNSLEHLKLREVSGMRSLSDVTESSLSSCLKRLEIWYCLDLSEIPSSTLECCTCLEELEVRGCPELGSFPLNLQQTPCLSQITLTRCPKLFTTDGTLPRGFEHLTNLKRLSIGPDNSEQSIDWNGLRTGCSTTLQHLSMKGSCRTQLPQQLQHFSSLVSLSLSTFDSECLPDWLGKLTSLQRLYLEDCPKLEHLPTEAIRSLSNLQNLYISGCPLLRETQGDEIKALPNLKVNWPDY